MNQGNNKLGAYQCMLAQDGIERLKSVFLMKNMIRHLTYGALDALYTKF
jgi:hypothetical protein